MRKILLILLLMPLFASAPAQSGAGTGEQVVTFRFLPGDDMFYVRENEGMKDNADRLRQLSLLIGKYRSDIISGDIPVCVDGYSASLKTERANRKLSYLRASRVKAELILNNGLLEEHFRTSNHPNGYEGQQEVVIVTLRIPVKEAAPAPKPETTPPPAPEPEPEPEPEPDPRPEPAQVAGPEPLRIPPYPPMHKGWYLGANIGMPFFWGDFLSTAADKTYIGLSAGIYGGYQFNSWLGVSLSLDYAANKTGHRDYAAGYLLDPQGMTWYTPKSGTTHRYDELYGKIQMFSIGLHADLNANRLFGRRAAAFPLKLIVSPAVYANTFSPKIFTSNDDAKYVADNLSQSFSLGLGGDVALRYDINTRVGVQLKGTGMWITDNLFDNIRTVGYVKQNAMWGVSAGVILKFDKNK